MTFHLSGGAADEAGRVVLRCDAEGCGKQFTIRAFAAAKTRASAGVRGWGPATREDRRDFCPEHVADAASLVAPCGARFGASDEERCEKPVGHEAESHANPRFIWGPGVADFVAEAAPLTGGLLDLLEDVRA